VQWAATVALNGWISFGSGSAGSPVHMIEHKEGRRAKQAIGAVMPEQDEQPASGS
jgi:hypothetical protein